MLVMKLVEHRLELVSYARKMMNVYPDFEGFFKVRELKAGRI